MVNRKAALLMSSSRCVMLSSSGSLREQRGGCNKAMLGRWHVVDIPTYIVNSEPWLGIDENTLRDNSPKAASIQFKLMHLTPLFVTYIKVVRHLCFRCASLSWASNCLFRVGSKAKYINLRTLDFWSCFLSRYTSRLLPWDVSWEIQDRDNVRSE